MSAAVYEKVRKPFAMTDKIGGVETGVFKELTDGLLTSFREIQGSKDENFMKVASKRAHAKIGITRAITDIAKTAIAGKKALAIK